MSAQTNTRPARDAHAVRGGALIGVAGELARALVLLEPETRRAFPGAAVADVFDLLRQRSEECGRLMLLGELLASTVDQLADEQTPRKRVPALADLARTQVRAFRAEVARQRGTSAVTPSASVPPAITHNAPGSIPPALPPAHPVAGASSSLLEAPAAGSSTAPAPAAPGAA